MIAGREVLEKNDFLEGLESIFKKYGYTRAYSSGTFSGSRQREMYMHISAPSNDTASSEIEEYVVFDRETDDDGAAVFINDVVDYPEKYIIYDNGTFYRR